MSSQRIATRYAKSLLDLGIERGDLDQMVEDVKTVQSALSSRDLFLLIKSPIVNTSKKKDIFKRLFAEELGVTINKFFEIMLRKGRENHLPEILDAFQTQYKTYKKISTVVLTSATPLADKIVQQIREKLLESSSTQENLDLQLQVDPELIGGFKLQYEGKEYDASLAYKLDMMRKQFSTN